MIRRYTVRKPFCPRCHKDRKDMGRDAVEIVKKRYQLTCDACGHRSRWSTVSFMGGRMCFNAKEYQLEVQPTNPLTKGLV